MKLKVCGMKYNPKEVAQLQPNYLGFIFWGPSSRYFDGEIPQLSSSIKKVGVFVDASAEDVIKKVNEHQLHAVQLHGKESAEYCGKLKDIFLSFRAQLRKKKASDRNKVSTPLDLSDLDIIKVFSIKDDFDFSILKDYEEVCNYFLFDTKGKLPGGNGYTFDWKILKNYPSNKPYFLSGGIGLEETEKLQSFLESPASKYCYAIDVNSRFETEPGLKNIEKLKIFKKLLIEKHQPKTDKP
ncbi:phosphoribosylanthranilate isomerase [Muricauda sp. JGD-17]|uniref:N-(5'-phosphoribosyl)anthranilate isomerase n=1 Tax=Flagellimonas ochracea TaxID=2696472 RepID=A0A964WXX5_9FLAO|nr:phosphoribosylanthranilate isomerase [Allomuricauda ochracea]NAY92530.1 phosphoribosylanthranilate isomerase [Allomuricauda ochracea]